MGQVVLASEEPQERSALLCDVITDCAAQHGIAGLERVEDGALRDRAVDFEGYFAVDMSQRS